MIKINKGIFASEGLSKGKVILLSDEEIKIVSSKVDDIKAEIKKYENSLDVAKKQIFELKNSVFKKMGEEKAQIFDAHIEILQDPIMKKEIISLLEEKNNSLYSVNSVYEKYIKMFKDMDDEYMKERASDLNDILGRLLSIISNKKQVNLSEINEESIIVSYDLTPSQTAQLNPKYVKGFITKIGGRTSHSAIMARTLGIPAVVGLDSSIDSFKENMNVIIDTHKKEILINPNNEAIKDYDKKMKQMEILENEKKSFKNKSTQTKCGRKLTIAGNIGSPKDMDYVIDNGGEGVGLFRSEFLYMDSEDWPDEETQYKAYSSVIKKTKDLVIIRTLDIGGDKKLNYYKFPEEMNPFLGNRAVRFCLQNPKIFKTQLRALLRASVHGNLGINIPMISTSDEIKEVLEIFEETKRELSKEKIKYSNNIKIGIMVETPSILFMMNKITKYIDFISIGSNDLIQYMYAADRMSQNVSYLYQPFNPSTLKAIDFAIKGTKNLSFDGKKKNVMSAICGEMGSELRLVPVLIGMGIDEISVSPSSILKLRSLISKITYKESKELVKRILLLENQKEVLDEIMTFFAKKNIEYYL